MNDLPTKNGFIDFDAMNKKQAQAFMERWIATTPERRRWLSEAMTADGYPALREDIESLEVVGDWLTKHAKLRDGMVLGGPIPDLSGVNPAELPMWYDQSAASAWMFDDWTIWAIDSVALNFGHVMTTLHSDVTWVVAHERTKRYIDQNHPCLLREGETVPLNPVAVPISILFGYMMHGTLASESLQQRIDSLLNVRQT